MLVISAMTATKFPAWVAQRCRDHLCWEGSEMQRVFDRIITHSLNLSERHWMLCYARVQPDYFDEEHVEIVGWVSVTEWVVGKETRIQVQGFVAEQHRGKGVAGAMVVAVCHDMPKHPLPIAVFSPEFFSIAKRLGWHATEYKSVEDGWIAVGNTTFEGRDRGTRSDSAGIHVDAPAVCDLPLARDEAGEEA